MLDHGVTKLKSKLIPGLYPIENTEFGSDEGMGWIGHLVTSQIWSSNGEWPEEVISLARNIQHAGSSLGPAGEQARRARDEKAAALKEVLRAHDPMYALGHMAQRAAFDSGDYRDWYAIHGVHALVEYAVGVAYGGPIVQESPRKPPDQDIQGAFDLVAEIFALDWFLVQYSGDSSQPLHIRRARGLLRMEGLTDRWQGYGAHLTTILHKTFARIEDHVISELGWNPVTLPEISTAISHILQQRMGDFQPAARRKLIRARAAGHIRYDEALKTFLQEHNEFSRQLFSISAPELARVLSWPEEKTKRALGDLAFTPGSQPDFTLPTQDNLVRMYSLVALSDDQYFAWLPGALIQESHAWFNDLLQKRNLESLRNKYLAARDAATEELTTESLARVFGADRAFGNVYYPAEGRPDVDCVVIIPRDALVVECKAHLLTGPGRRGAPGRLSTKFDELVTKPAKQAERFVDHLRNGGAAFDHSGRQLSLPVDHESILPRMVVTYERVDPLATSMAILAEGNAKEPAWILPLADLLVVVDLLSSPSVFWHYATIRWRQSQEQELSVQTEVDALGLFLDDKDVFQSLARQIESQSRIYVGPSGQAINNYYTGHASDRKKPTIAVPTLVLESLDQMLKANSSHWKETVTAVMSEPNKTWARLRSVQRKLRAAKQPRRARISTKNPALAVWIERDASGALQVEIHPSHGDLAG